ncbi:hypothetical protein [Kocuria nitroreducens]|uniref:hypothetical protein n=1 Tax=Kocuria nitroreducens TaxID=3058914 RepID=UPI0036DCD86B
MASTSGSIWVTSLRLPPVRLTCNGMPRYLGPDLLERAGIHDFDTWAATFGQVVSEMELSVAGGDHSKLKDRFAKFQNAPELLKTFHTFADVKTAKDLKLPARELVEREDGKRLPRMVPVGASAELQDYIEEVGRRAERIQARMVDRHEDNMLKISGDGRKAALDMRLVDPELGSIVSETKVNVTADLIAQVHQEHQDDVFLDPASGEEHPTRGALQIVFCDQIMRGSLDVREIEDLGDNTLSFAEVKAISSGNPLILEKSKADQEPPGWSG